MIDHLGTKYDYGSIMHYSAMAFSKNGKPTIEPIQKDVKIGQREKFSDIDLFKINKLYNCPNQQILNGSIYFAYLTLNLRRINVERFSHYGYKTSRWNYTEWKQ